jgi:spermidine/putrescine transport system ATP-binding protein
MSDPGARGEIVLDGVTKLFGSVVAVDELDLTIPGGEFFSMLGPSGCGKTTTLRMIGGFEEPTAGRILLQGEDVTWVPPAKRNVNMVFQAYGLFPHMTVADNVAFGLKIKRIKRSEIGTRVAEALRMVRLEGLDERRPRQLSGGQQQRVALARALVNRPAALLLDEPLGALDLKLRKEMQLELKAIAADSATTFVYVTHDQEEAMSMSDRVVVMREGHIEQVGSPVEIYRRPRSPFVARFLGMSNVFAATVAAVGDGWVELDGTGLPLRAPAPAPPPAAGQGVTAVIRPDSFEVRRATDGPATADSVPGDVSDVRFIGSLVHYRVTAGDRHWQVSARAGGGEVLPEGTSVRLSWRADEVILLPGAPGPAAGG